MINYYVKLLQNFLKEKLPLSNIISNPFNQTIVI